LKTLCQFHVFAQALTSGDALIGLGQPVFDEPLQGSSYLIFYGFLFLNFY
jgi:hypothetical protein